MTKKFDHPDRIRGREFTKGVIDVTILPLFIFCLISFLLNAPDDSDRGWFDRSGVKPVYDAKTGKEYLISPYGGIIERAEAQKGE